MRMCGFATDSLATTRPRYRLPSLAQLAATAKVAGKRVSGSPQLRYTTHPHPPLTRNARSADVRICGTHPKKKVRGRSEAEGEDVSRSGVERA